MYYGDYSLTKLCMKQASKSKLGATMFGKHADFFEAVRGGTLPNYTFLEPNYIIDVSSEHPPFNVARGEQFLASVYLELSTSKIWNDLLFVIAFDEHGGCYDHVPPPWGAVEPDSHTQEGFDFDRFGVRVPAVFVSPFVSANTILRSSTKQPFDHCSILKTLCKWMDLPAGWLPSKRVNSSETPTFEHVLTLTSPREAPDLPAPPPVHGDTAGGDARLGVLQRSIVESVAAERRASDPAEPKPIRVLADVGSVNDAVRYLGLDR